MNRALRGRRGPGLLALALGLVLGGCGRSALEYGDPSAGSGVGGGSPGGVGGVGVAAGLGGAGGSGGAAIGVGGSRGSGGAGVGGASGVGGAFSGSLLISITGRLREIAIDSRDAHIYLANSSQNRIEDFALASGALQAPINVGSSPSGLDLTPDDRFLYVANQGGANISVVDLASRTELRKINVPSGFSGDTPFSIAIAGNGRALFSTTFAGSGFGGRMLALDLATDLVSLKGDFFVAGTTTEATVLRASGDRSAVAAIAGDISSAPVFVYRAANNAFTPEHDLQGFISNVAINRDGSAILVDGSYLLDGDLNLLGTIPGRRQGASFAPRGPNAYRAQQGKIEIVDTSRFLVTGSVPVSDTMQGTFGGSTVGRMVITSDGKQLAVITDHGLSLVALP